MATDFYEPVPDPLTGENPPAKGTYAVARWLRRRPRTLHLVNTTDGSSVPVKDDGGKVEGGTVPPEKWGQHRQLAYRMARRAREDEAFKGLPLFVAAEPIPPVYPGDPLSTGPGGMITLQTKEHEKLIKASIDVRNQRIKSAREEGVAKVASNLRVGPPKTQNDVVAELAEALKDLSSGGEVDKLKAQIKELEEELAKKSSAPPAKARGAEGGHDGRKS